MAGKSSSSGNDELGLLRALRFYSGGALKRIDKDGYKQLDKRLEKGGYTAFEYIHYVVHYHDPYKTNWDCLRKPNILASATCWEEFKVWKKEWRKEVECAALLQYERAEAHASTGYDRTEILTQGFLAANALSRIELALYWEEQGHELNSELVVNGFASEAAELALGAPEWLLVAPKFKEFAVQKYHEDTEEEEWILLYMTMQKKRMITTR